LIDFFYPVIDSSKGTCHMRMIVCLLAALLGATLLQEEGKAASLSPALAVKPAEAAVKIRYRRHYHGGYSGLFRQWCAYNCYYVPPCSHGCYGRYGYSHFAYDEDLPFPHRWDRDASPIDNADAYIYRYTGEPIIRAFERLY
jgi:hypothetical protein